MKLLALDTSTMAGSVALFDDGQLVGEVLAQLRGNHSDALLPLIDDVLARGGIALSQVERLAVGLGPGSFTGVRIGVATAKGLRIATGASLSGVGSLQALTAAAVGARGLVAAVIDARRDEVFATLSRVDARGDRAELIAPWNGRPEQVGATLRTAAGSDEILAIGDLSEALWERVGRGAGGGLSLLPSVVGMPLARFVAHEALAGRGVADDDDALEPIYVRPSDAKLPSPANKA